MAHCRRLSIDQVVAQLLEDDEEDNEQDVYSDDSDDNLNEEEENDDDEANMENEVQEDWRRLTTTSGEFETKRDFNFCASPGVQEEIQDEYSIYDYFRLFFTNSITEDIVYQTNMQGNLVKCIQIEKNHHSA